MYVVDAVFLLLTTDEGGLDRGGMYRKPALAAAAVADLAADGRVEVSEQRNPLISALDPTPTGQPVLDAILSKVEKRGRKLSSLLIMPGANLVHAEGQALAAEGVVSEKARVLIGPAFPTEDPGPEREVRQRIADLLDGLVRPPTLQDAAVLAILQGANVAFGVLKDERGQRTRPELRKLIDEIVEEFPLAVRLRKAMKDYAASGTAAAASA